KDFKTCLLAQSLHLLVSIASGNPTVIKKEGTEVKPDSPLFEQVIEGLGKIFEILIDDVDEPGSQDGIKASFAKGRIDRIGESEIKLLQGLARIVQAAFHAALCKAQRGTRKLIKLKAPLPGYSSGQEHQQGVYITHNR